MSVKGLSPPCRPAGKSSSNQLLNILNRATLCQTSSEITNIDFALQAPDGAEDHAAGAMDPDIDSGGG